MAKLKPLRGTLGEKDSSTLLTLIHIAQNTYYYWQIGQCEEDVYLKAESELYHFVASMINGGTK